MKEYTFVLEISKEAQQAITANLNEGDGAILCERQLIKLCIETRSSLYEFW
jgi:hypothetical protein